MLPQNERNKVHAQRNKVHARHNSGNLKTSARNVCRVCNSYVTQMFTFIIGATDQSSGT